MTSRSWTKLVLVAVGVVLIAWDIWLYVSPAPADTISRVLFDTATEHPILPFVFGVLAGHWFWGLRARGA